MEGHRVARVREARQGLGHDGGLRDYRLLRLNDPCKQRVEADPHSGVRSCGVEVARETAR